MLDGGGKLKRIIVWIDVEDEGVEQVCKKLEKLNSVEAKHKIVQVCEIRWSTDRK